MPAAVGATEVQTVKMTINGREVEALAGQTILEAARGAGVDIPTLCHDPRLEPYGACRLCLVEVEGARGPMASCGTKVNDGMKIETHSEKIVKLRKFVLELLLTNHPLDCPVCEAAGDCRLQDYAYEYLVDMVPWGWRAPEASDPGSHPNVAHFGSRCILCGRCVRICREVMSIGCWGYLNRGYESEVDTPYRRPLDEVGCVSCGQCVSTCPVGAVTTQRAPMGARQWQTEKTRTTCSYCSNGCELIVHTYGGRVVRVASEIESGLNKGNLCVKGRFGQGYADSPDRLLKPLVRNADGELVEASWDEAIGRVADELARLKAEDKAQAFALLCGTHCTNETAYLAQKMARTVVGSNNVASSDQALKTSVQEALGAALGCEGATGDRTDLEKAGVILVVGSNLTESNPVLALSVIRAIRQGRTVIVIDPRTTELARRATIHLAPKPGMDLALLRSMVTHVLDLGLDDKGFVAAHVDGLEGLRASLAGVDADAQASGAGVDPADVRRAAEEFAKAETAAVLLGTGIMSSPDPSGVVAALADLVLLTGNVGKPGSGVFPLLGGANSQGLSDMGVAPATDSQGRALRDIFEGLESGDIRFLYVIGCDPALEYPDESLTANGLREAFLVVQDSFLTSTASLADVVLPAAVAVEDEGSYTNVERLVQWVRAARSPRGESLPDLQIIHRVANKLGADWPVCGADDVMREIADLVPGYSSIPSAGLDKDGSASFYVGGGNGRPGPAVEGWKGTLVPIPPSGAQEPERGDGTLTLITGSALQHHESGVRSRRAEGLTRLNAAAVIQVNPADAATMGLSDGETVRVSAESGATVELAATVTDRVPEGVVFMPGFDPAAPLTRLVGRDRPGVSFVKVQAL